MALRKYHTDKWGMIGDYWPQNSYDELGRKILSPDGWVDGGDSLQRMGTMMFTDAVIGNTVSYKYIDEIYNQLEVNWGNYRRHPDTDFWYSDPDRMSRDQLLPNLAAWGLLSRKRLFKFFLGHLTRGLLFTTNTRRNGATKDNHGQIYKVVDGKNIKRNYNWKLPDLTGPGIWAMYIRGFRLWPLYPILCILDIEYFINSILKRTLNKDDNDIINHVIEGIYSAKVMPTPLVWLANKFINKADDMCKRLDKYFGLPKDPKFLGKGLKILIKRYLS